MATDRETTAGAVVVVAFLVLAVLLGAVAGLWNWLTTRTEAGAENEAAAQRQGFLKSLWDGVVGAASMVFL